MIRRNVTRLPLGQRIATGAISAVLGLSMTIPFGATAALAEDANATPEDGDEASAEATSVTAKKEIVYTKTDASGQSEGSYVVNAFETPDEEDVSDPGTYEEVKNLTTSEELEDEDGSVELTTVAGEPFYYQGNLSAGTQLPWDVTITYRLDGEEISPEDLAGQDGELDIELKIEGLDDGSATADFAQSFLVQAQGTFPNENFELDEAKDATIATNGGSTVLTYLLIPGEDGDWHITGRASSFTYSGWQIAAMPLNLDIDLDDFDTSELSDETQELEDGATQLAEGGESLRDALGLINNGALSATSGSATLANGADSLATGTSQAVSGTAQLDSGAATLATGAASLSSGLNQLDDGTDELAAGASSLLAAIGAQSGTFEQLSSGSAQVAAGVDSLATTLGTTLPQTLAQAQTSLDGIRTELDGVETAAGQLNAAGQTAQSQGQQLATDLQNLDSGLTQLNGGLTQAGTDAGTAAAQATSAQSSATTAANEAGSAASQLQNLLNTDADLTDAERQAIQAAISSANSAQTDATAAATAAGSAASSATTAASEVSTVGTQAAQGFSSSNVQADAQALANTLQGISAGITGTGGLSDQANKVINDSENLITSTQASLSGLSSQLDQLATLQGGAHQVADGAAALTYTLTTQGVDASGQPTMLSALTSLSAGAESVSTGTSAAASGATQVASGAESLKEGLDTLSSGSTQLNSGAHTLASGARTLASGLGELSDGTGQAYAGAETLSAGLDELSESVQGMDQQILDGIQDIIDEKLGSDYELHSFVEPGNTNVKEVQFVYVVDGVKEPEEDDANDTQADEDDEQDQSFAERLAALFSRD